MKVFQKVLISILLATVVFTGFAIAAYSGLFDLIETRFYSQRVRATARTLMDESATITEQYLQALQRDIGQLAANPSIGNVFLVNQSRQDIENQEQLLGDLLDARPEIDFVRIVDNNRGQLWLSTLADDVRSRSATRIEYEPVEALDPPLQLPSPEEGDQGAAWVPARAAIRVTVPIIDTFSIPRGLLVAWVGTSGLYTELVSQGVIGPSNRVRLTPDGNLLLNAPRHFGVEDLAAVDAATVEAADSAVLDTDSDASFVIERAEATAGVPPLFFLVNERTLRMDPALQYVLLGSVFLLTFLISYLILNIRQDPTVVVAERFRRFQQSVVRDYLREGRAIDPDLWKRELETRKDQIEREIKRGLGRTSEETRQAMTQTIERNWEELHRLIGSQGALPASGKAELEPVSLQQIEAIIERTLARYGSMAPVRTVRSRSGDVQPPVDERVEVPSEEREAPQPTNTPSATPPSESPFAGMKPVDVEDVDEVEELDELEPEDAAEPEELAELEPEEIEEAEELAELDELEPEDAAEPEELAELDELEPEEAEELAELEPEEIEEAEELAELDELEPEAAAEPEELAELEPEEIEEAEELAELDELEPEDAAEPEELAELEPEEIEEAEELAELDELEPEDAAEPEELAELEPEEIEEAEELAELDALEPEEAEELAELDELEPEDAAEPEELAELDELEPEEAEELAELDELEPEDAAEPEELAELDELEPEEAEELAELDELEPEEGELEPVELAELDALEPEEVDELEPEEAEELAELDELEPEAAAEPEELAELDELEPEESEEFAELDELEPEESEELAELDELEPEDAAEPEELAELEPEEPTELAELDDLQPEVIEPTEEPELAEAEATDADKAFAEADGFDAIAADFVGEIYIPDETIELIPEDEWIAAQAGGDPTDSGETVVALETAVAGEASTPEKGAAAVQPAAPETAAETPQEDWFRITHTALELEEMGTSRAMGSPDGAAHGTAITEATGLHEDSFSRNADVSGAAPPELEAELEPEPLAAIDSWGEHSGADKPAPAADVLDVEELDELDDVEELEDLLPHDDDMADDADEVAELESIDIDADEEELEVLDAEEDPVEELTVAEDELLDDDPEAEPLEETVAPVSPYLSIGSSFGASMPSDWRGEGPSSDGPRVFRTEEIRPDRVFIRGVENVNSHHVVEIDDFVALAGRSQDVITERDGLAQITPSAYFAEVPVSDRQIQTLAEQVLLAQDVASIDDVFGSAFSDIDFGDIMGSDGDNADSGGAGGGGFSGQRSGSDSGDSSLRLVSGGFELPLVADYGDAGVRQIYRQLVRLTRRWDARIAIVLEQKRDGSMVGNFGLGMPEGCDTPLSLQSSSSLVRNVVSLRRVALLKQPLSSFADFGDACHARKTVAIGNWLFLPLRDAPVRRYLMVGFSRSFQDLSDLAIQYEIIPRAV